MEEYVENTEPPWPHYKEGTKGVKTQPHSATANPTRSQGAREPVDMVHSGQCPETEQGREERRMSVEGQKEYTWHTLS